jgi:hypothetical protein
MLQWACYYVHNLTEREKELQALALRDGIGTTEERSERKSEVDSRLIFFVDCPATTNVGHGASEEF